VVSGEEINMLKIQIDRRPVFFLPLSPLLVVRILFSEAKAHPILKGFQELRVPKNSRASFLYPSYIL